MRLLKTAAFSCVALFAFSTSSMAGTGHWYCTSDGIKAWSTDASKKDAAGWTYSGDTSSYADGGKCKKG